MKYHVKIAEKECLNQHGGFDFEHLIRLQNHIATFLDGTSGKKCLITVGDGISIQAIPPVRKVKKYYPSML